MAAEKWTEAELTEMLRHRYSGHKWAFAAQVPNATGMKKTRTCDGIAMGLWPSEGLHLHGFEVKVSRSDWRKEMQDVTKSSAFSVYCHYWWIVAPKEAVKLEELPADWGLLSPVTANRVLRVQKPATFKATPEQPTVELLAGIFRACCQNSVSARELESARSEGYREGLKAADSRAKSSGDSELIRLRRLVKDHEEAVAEFEEASGVPFRNWNSTTVGKAVAMAMNVKTTTSLRDELANANRKLQDLALVSKQTLDGLTELIQEQGKCDT